MIKILKLSNKSVRRFTTNKEWKYSTLSSDDSLILEQGDDIPIFIDSETQLATEQNKADFKLNITHGKNIKGTFFSKDSKYFDEKTEPLNFDGSYQRVVYNSMKHLFYNEYGLAGNVKYDKYYKNPLNVFGGESGKYTPLDFKSDIVGQDDDGERRVLGDEVTVLEIPTHVFGEKIKPTSFKITDYSSPYDAIEITDDGNTNLVVGSKTFNEISEVGLNKFIIANSETSSADKKINIDYTDLTYGYVVASSDDYFISGAPILTDSPSELQSGRASLHKYDKSTKRFELLREFYCPFTQSGIAHETGNDNCQFILTELGNIVTSENSLINDSFGKSVELRGDICAVGSPNSHITGRNSDQATGHIFVYDKNKGGSDNWGIVNVFEGDPSSEFGTSISVDGDYMVVGAPNLNDGNGGVYVFKKTKRTKSHPWIKTSTIYESYKWNDVIKKYEGLPKQDDEDYIKYLRRRDVIVSKKILKNREHLQEKKDLGEITEEEYIDNLTTPDDYSQVFPFNYLYSHGDDCSEVVGIENMWYKHRYWNAKTHPSVKCKISEDNNYYQKAVWPGYIADENDGSYIPNPDHEQNKENKWAYRWKVQNVSGDDTPLGLFEEDEFDCNDEGVSMFSGPTVNTFGDVNKYPVKEYTESPPGSLGDTTFDLIGMVLPPTKSIRRFGENVKLKGDNLYTSNPSTSTPRCYAYSKQTNKYGCEVWELTHTLSDTGMMGHSTKEPTLTPSINSVSINYYDSYVEVELCPSIEDYATWVWKMDTALVDENKTTGSKKIVGGSRVEKCDSVCPRDINYLFHARYDKINNKDAGQIPANYGASTDLKFEFFPSYIKVDTLNIDYTHTTDIGEVKVMFTVELSETKSWKYQISGNPIIHNMLVQNEGAVTSAEFITSPGEYTLTVWAIDSPAPPTSNYSRDKRFFRIHEPTATPTPTPTHSQTPTPIPTTSTPEPIIVDLTHRISGRDRYIRDHDDWVDRSPKTSPKFFSKARLSNSFYKIDSVGSPTSTPDTNTTPTSVPVTNTSPIGLSWKNFRENISFVYPNVKAGTKPSFMTIYSNAGKTKVGKYDPIHTVAEIGAQETLNGELVRLIFNVGQGDSEFYYEFLFMGSVEGTHFTLNELTNKLDYQYTLPANLGNHISISSASFSDTFLDNKSNAKFFSKGETGLSYVDSSADDNTIALSWKNFRENVSFSYPSVKAGTKPSFMTIYSNEAKNSDGSYNPIHTLAEVGAQETLNGKKVRLTFNTGSIGGDEFYYEFLFRGSVEGTHFTLNELRDKFDYECTLPPNQGHIKSIADEQFDDFLSAHAAAKFFSKGENELSYVEPHTDDDTLGLSWKNFRENVSFSYPAVKAGTKPSFMTIYSNEARQEDGGYDPIYTLAEIGAQETLNGETVRLTFNTGFVGGDEFYYEFIFKGTPTGTHYTLSELRDVVDDMPELPANLGVIRKIRDFRTNDIFKKCRQPKFYSKGENELSYVDPWSTTGTIALSWKNFRENISFSYPPVKAGTEPSFMAIYSNEAKQDDGSYDPIYMLAEIGAQETLNGQTVKLIINADNCEADKTKYYEFMFRGSREGTHYTLNELVTELDYDCTLPPNIGTYISIDEFSDENAKFFSKGVNALSYVEPWSSADTIALSWKNFRENISFSYPSVKAGTKPSFMTIYSNEAKNFDGSYNPIHTLAEVGAQETLNGETVRLTLNTGSVGGAEFYYEFMYIGSTEGTHFTLNELKDKFDYDCTLPPNFGSYVSSDDKKFFSKGVGGIPYIEPWSPTGTMEVSWKNFQENVSFSYPAVNTGAVTSTMSIYSNDAKQPAGGYAQLKILAEIGAQETLNGEKVRLTLNTGSVGGDEFYYEFIFRGSELGTHFTLNELKDKFEYECTLPPNLGGYVELGGLDFEDFLLNRSEAKFFTKTPYQDSYSESTLSDDTISLSWKNFRENVSFSYPSVKAGTKPSFMTIYSNGANLKDGSYDPLYTLAEIGAQETLNGQKVRLTLNTGSVGDDEFYYEFTFDGDVDGTHYTLNELIDRDDEHFQLNRGTHLEKVYIDALKPTKSSHIQKQRIEFVTEQYAEKLTREYTEQLIGVKSFGCLPANKGTPTKNNMSRVPDDMLQSGADAQWYSRNEDLWYKENSNLQNEIEISWNNVRENVSFHYPTKVAGETPITMKIYAPNHRLKQAVPASGRDSQVHIPDYILAEITATETLNGEVVRLTFNTGMDTEFFYEFLFDGTSEGTQYTLDELSWKPSPRLKTPLLIRSPEFEHCKIRIDKESLGSGFHVLHLALVDANNIPIDGESTLGFFNNPTLYDTQPRQMLVNKTFRYGDIKSEFGTALDASDEYLIIGNPSDREYSPLSDQGVEYEAGAVFVFRLHSSGGIDFFKKVYGESDSEVYFNFRFGCDVSLLGDNFLVGGYADEYSNISIVESGSEKKVEIEDFLFGASKFTDDSYATTEVLITNYQHDLNSEFGDTVIKIDIGSLDIDRTKLSDIEVRADFIDTGRDTIRIEEVRGHGTDGINGVYVKMKNPINVKDGCDIEGDESSRVYMSKNGWSIYWEDIRDTWVLTDTPNTSYEYQETFAWKDYHRAFDLSVGLNEFDILSTENLSKLFELYEVTDSIQTNTWKSRIQNVYPENKLLYIDLIIELESIGTLDITEDVIKKLFSLYRLHSVTRIGSDIEARWLGSMETTKSILPIINELNAVNSIYVNFELLKRTISELYKISDGDVIISWANRLGYNYTLTDVLSEVRPTYYDKINKRNLNILFKIHGVPDGEFRDKWKSRINLGFLLCDVYSEITNRNTMNFSLSSQSSSMDMPTKFTHGFGSLENLNIKVTSNNDTTGQNGSLAWGIYRDETRIVGSQIHIYVNTLDNIDFPDSIIFVYNSIKNAVNGYVYYYSIHEGECNRVKRLKTNKGKYTCKKQYGHSVSLSKDFIYIGSPILGNFNIDNLVTFGFSPIVSFGTSDSMFLEYDEIHPKYINDLNKNVVGSVISYDHSALRDDKKYFLGNVFYKNGIVSLTDTDGYFSNILTNSGSSGFELEFKSTQTLYENEIVCKIDPHEFNFSTNPTSLVGGSIAFDVNEDGKFDIDDVTYIFKYIMGGLTISDVDQQLIDEENKSIAVSTTSRNWPTEDIVLTESEDVLLMDLFMKSDLNTNGPNYNRIVAKLKKMHSAGEFDIDGDGVTSAADAKLLMRYFIGRTGLQLTRGLVDGYGDATRYKSTDIIEYLNEKTGKNIGRRILSDFRDYDENDKKDSLGSYLAPYATTVGLYSGLELVMVAKLGKPIKILPNYPINFLIKFDS